MGLGWMMSGVRFSCRLLGEFVLVCVLLVVLLGDGGVVLVGGGGGGRVVFFFFFFFCFCFKWLSAHVLCRVEGDWAVKTPLVL